MASKMPVLMMREPRSWPFDSAGTRKDWVTTVMMMTIMLTRAKPLALASCGTLAGLLHWADEGHCLCDVAVEGQWVRDGQYQQNHDSSPVGEQPEEWHVFERREQVIHDLGYCVAYDHAECHHAAKSTAEGQWCDSCAIDVQRTKAIALWR